jgi:MafB19-like deaminase
VLQDELKQLPFDYNSAYLKLKSEIAAKRFILAARRLAELLRKAGFNPAQPRNPAGQSDGGQWVGDGTGKVTLATARGRTSVPVIIRGRVLEASPAQAAKLALAQVRAREAIRQVRKLDPSWNPRPSLSARNVEGEIRTLEFEAIQAEARLAELARIGMGGNNGPPLGEPAPRFGTGSASPPPFEAISAYHRLTGMPDLATSIAARASEGTVAFGEINGRYVFGVNSNAPGYTVADQTAAEAMRDQLVEQYPNVMQTENLGRKPNDALFHAEANALMRAAKANSGTLAGRTMEVQVDRPMCDSCDKVLPLIGLQLGNPTVRFRDSRGGVKIIKNGEWIE